MARAGCCPTLNFLRGALSRAQFLPRRCCTLHCLGGKLPRLHVYVSPGRGVVHLSISIGVIFPSVPLVFRRQGVPEFPPCGPHSSPTPSFSVLKVWPLRELQLRLCNNLRNECQMNRFSFERKKVSIGALISPQWFSAFKYIIWRAEYSRVLNRAQLASLGEYR